MPPRRLLSPLLILALWQAASMSGLLSPRTLAAPATIAAAAWGLTISGVLPYHILISTLRMAAGLTIGITIGAAFALIAGLTRIGEDAVDAPLQMLRALPFVGLAPLFILWFGIGEAPKIALVALGTTFPVYLNLFAGIRGTDPKLIEAGRVFGLTRAGLIRQIILPSALPSALTGLRYALGVALLSLVVAEQINATAGIGFLITDARDFLRTDIMLVGLLVYALLGLAGDAIVRRLERAALPGRARLIDGR